MNPIGVVEGLPRLLLCMHGSEQLKLVKNPSIKFLQCCYSHQLCLSAPLPSADIWHHYCWLSTSIQSQVNYRLKGFARNFPVPCRQNYRFFCSFKTTILTPDCIFERASIARTAWSREFKFVFKNSRCCLWIKRCKTSRNIIYCSWGRRYTTSKSRNKESGRGNGARLKLIFKEA